MANKGYSRSQRVGELIQNALADILQKDVKNMRLGIVTITSVEVSPDLSFAKVFISVLDDNRAKEIIDTLNQSTKFLRFELAHAVKLRIVPELKFIYDDSSLRGSRISSLINDALKNTE